MEVMTYGIYESHKADEFSLKMNFDFWGFFHFYTPYVYEVDGKLINGNADEILITSPGTTVYYGPGENGDSFTNDWLYISVQDKKSSLFENFPLPILKPFSANKKNYINTCLKEIDNELKTKPYGFQNRIESLLEMLIIDLYREYKKGKHLISSYDRMSKARTKILSSLDTKWTLESMANVAQYSVSRFSELYLLYFDTTPKADLLKKRIELAEKLLVSTALPISEIAGLCGFNEPYFFSKTFNKKTGFSPTNYRKQAQQPPFMQ